MKYVYVLNSFGNNDYFYNISSISNIRLNVVGLIIAPLYARILYLNINFIISNYISK